MKRVFLYAVLLIILSVAGLIATGHKYVLTAVARTYMVGEVTANVDDHSVFDTRVIESATPQPWATEQHSLAAPLPPALAATLESDDTIAFLVVHHGKIIAERYFQGYSASSRTNSFSMAKTVVTLLLGMAIEDGLIDNLRQPLTDFLPEFLDDPNGSRATIGSLSTMTSGYAWDEHYYSPFSPTVELFYGDNVERFLTNGEFSHEPGEYFYYSSASTQLLAIALARALRSKDAPASLSDYLSEKLWQPLGMNEDAVWHLDQEGLELAYCCINTNARNFARIGQFMLQGGRWGDRQLIAESFIELMKTPTATHYYGYSTWLNNQSTPAYFALRGHLGQYVVVVPAHQLVIVRLGRSRGADEEVDGNLEFYVDQALDIVAASKQENTGIPE